MFMKLKRSITVLVFLMLLSSLAKGQYFSSGQDPASTKWKQINTANFQIIFPENFEVQAQYLANILDSAYALVAYSLNGTIKKTSIILHTQTVVSNGTTAWAPTRIDLHTTSPQQIYAQPWLDQLALHEIRHLIQIEKLNTGLTNVLKIILGEQALAFMTGIFIPQWFLEGDAVVTETALSNSGRGREPSFIMPIKAQLLEKGTFSYEKSVHGSYKDFVTDPYPLGYLMVASGRNKFGAKLWENTLLNTGRNPYQITPFSNAIKKTTGLNKQQFYYYVMDELKSKWDSIQSLQSFQPLEHLTKKPKDFTNYNHPLMMDEKNMLSVKRSIDDVQRIIKILPSGEEKIIFTPGPNLGDRLSYSRGLLCWSEVEFDARWQNRNFSVIKTYHLKSKKLTHLTKNSRLFSPALSHDAKKIAAIEQSTTDKSSLVILDALNGTELKRFHHPNHEFLMSPSWSEDDNKIVLITLNNQGKSIQVLNIISGQFEKQIPETYVPIANPRITNDTIYFSGAFSGTDNIYALECSSKAIFQISHVKFGAKDVFVDEKNDFLLYANYTSDGYEIVKQKLSDERWIPLTEIKKGFLDLPKTFSKQEKGILEIDHRVDKKFEAEKYRKASSLLDIHSWAPASINVNSYEVKPGFSMMSQNKLSTAFATLGYEYDLNESLGKYYFNYSYEGFYPIFELEVDHGKKRYYLNDSTHQIKFVLYDETNIETQVRLPLSFNKGRYYRGIQPSIKFRNSFLKELPDQKINFTQHAVHSMNYRLYLYNQIRSSSRDLYPAWGQILDFRVGHTPFQEEHKSWLVSAQSVFYFPGLFKHHGIKIVNGYQKRQEGVYHFPQEVNYPRGFYNQNDLELFRTSINYKFPLCYPDFHIGSLFYLKRLKLALYYDQAYGKNAKGNTDYRSTGFELTSDMYFFSLIAPVDMGVRYIYYPDNKTNVFEFLFYIDFSALY
ncbi:MAG: hypothetical protein CVU00_01710 [Bacteroidetes bacterium HGW-Bacteroidetes-17]|nr:MAG: hypothetical protein CVU00_01710 [Bacteroidetes bacterium HGW-Bacteroidetes-17]